MFSCQSAASLAGSKCSTCVCTLLDILVLNIGKIVMLNWQKNNKKPACKNVGTSVKPMFTWTKFCPSEIYCATYFNDFYGILLSIKLNVGQFSSVYMKFRNVQLHLKYKVPLEHIYSIV